MRLGLFLFLMPKPPKPESVGLPPRPFLYTLDQIAMLIEVEVTALSKSYVFYEGRSFGARPKGKLLARNIAPDNKRPVWRVAEAELIRWMRTKGFRFQQRDPWLKI